VSRVLQRTRKNILLERELYGLAKDGDLSPSTPARKNILLVLVVFRIVCFLPFLRLSVPVDLMRQNYTGQTTGSTVLFYIGCRDSVNPDDYSWTACSEYHYAMWALIYVKSLLSAG
jgi:hypothetical protein